MAVAIPYIIAGIAAAGSYSQSQHAKETANYQAGVQKVNAQNILSQAYANEDAQRRASAVKMGQQRAGIAESGLSLTSGTGADLTEASALNSEVDALNIRYSGIVNSKNATAQSQLYSNEANYISNSQGLTVASAALNGYTSGGGKFTQSYNSVTS